MKDINQRFSEIRASCNMSQEEFGKILGLTKSGVSDIERGKRNVTEQHIIMLSNWKERKVNTEWLRSGDGEMFIQLPEEDETAIYVEELLSDDGDNPLYGIIKEIMHTYSELDPKSQEVLRAFSKKLRDNLAQEKRED